MWPISESEISVPMEISAAALRVSSRSSGRMCSNEVVEAFVRKPGPRKGSVRGKGETNWR
jgi:hypothetical protein